jgi:SpoVK/Ycf46/Vps4 family AAA+-type ATPase
MNTSMVENPADILGKIVVYFNRCDSDKKTDNPSKRKHSKTKSATSLPTEIKNYFIQLKTHPKLKNYRLSNKDINVIAAFWQSHIEKKDSGLSWNEICEKAGLNVYSISICIEYLNKLLRKRIISIHTKRYSPEHIKTLKLMKHDLVLEREFLMRLLGYDIITELRGSIRVNWERDEEFVEDMQKVMKLVLKIIDPDDDFLDRVNGKEHDHLFSATKLLYDNLNTCKNGLTIAKMVKENKLSHIEFTILTLVTYKDFFGGQGFQKNQILNLISRNHREYTLNSNYLEPEAKLVKKSLIETETQNYEPHTNHYKLDSSLKSALRNERQKNLKVAEKSSNLLVSTIKSNQNLSLIRTSQTIDELILPEEIKRTLEVLVCKQKDSVSNNLSQWGFGIKESYVDKRHKGCIALFYGVSGTGKTYAAGAIANALDKQLVAINCWQLRKHYYGQTEKNVKQTFKAIRHITEKFENPPVFLMNEADQVIHNRNESEKGSDYTENGIQNIILEEMESFPGILILTTNLIKIIDEAYYRRFNIKLEFPVPDTECRKKLWKLHLHDSIPGVESINIDYMAEYFPFTGGQISLVVQNACNEAITRTEEMKQLTMKDVVKYSNLEMPHKPLTHIKNIGFKPTATKSY